jgi:hypothetical protein
MLMTMALEPWPTVQITSQVWSGMVPSVHHVDPPDLVHP